jgi:hypothetical protein
VKLLPLTKAVGAVPLLLSELILPSLLLEVLAGTFGLLERNGGHHARSLFPSLLLGLSSELVSVGGLGLLPLVHTFTSFRDVERRVSSRR